jgi:hypothetical protein
MIHEGPKCHTRGGFQELGMFGSNNGCYRGVPISRWYLSTRHSVVQSMFSVLEPVKKNTADGEVGLDKKSKLDLLILKSQYKPAYDLQK